MRTSTKIRAQSRYANRMQARDIRNALLPRNSDDYVRKLKKKKRIAFLEVKAVFTAEACMYLGKTRTGFKCVMTEEERIKRNYDLRMKFIAKGCEGELMRWAFSREDVKRLVDAVKRRFETVTDEELG